MEKYYKILGLPTGADKKSVRKAYRHLAKIHHPDVSNAPDANERFNLITEAYQALYYGKFPRLRRKYTYKQQPQKPQRPPETTEQRKKRYAEAKAKMQAEKRRKEKEEFEKTYLYDALQIAKYFGRVFLLIFIVYVLTRAFIALFTGTYKIFIFYTVIAGILFFWVYTLKKDYFKLKLKNLTLDIILNYFKTRINAKQACFFSRFGVANGPAYLIRYYKILQIKTYVGTPYNHQVKLTTKVKQVHVPRNIFAYKIHFVTKLVRWFSVIVMVVFFPLESVVWKITFGIITSIVINNILFFITKVKTDYCFLFNYFLVIRLSLIVMVMVLATDFSNFAFEHSSGLGIWLILLFLMSDFIITPLVVEIKGNKLLRPIGKAHYKPINKLLNEGYQIGFIESIPAAFYPVFRWFF